MNKLFIFQNNASPKYAKELEAAYAIVKSSNNVTQINIIDLDINNLSNVDVIISNHLPDTWRIILCGLKIVSVVFDNYRNHDDNTDIIIDYFYKGNDKLFSGPEYRISNNKGITVQFNEIFDLISILEWDSSFWGYNVAYLSSRHLSENIIYRINKFIKQNQIRLVMYLCNCHDKKSVELAEKNGYEFKDIRLSYQKILKGQTNVKHNSEIQFRVATHTHIPSLTDISKDIYLDSRYYYDNNFDNNKVREFYMTWVERAVKREFDDDCFALFINKVSIAYCSVKYLSNIEARIGLIGVSTDHVRKGMGKIILEMVSNTLYSKGIKRIQVATQGRNYTAQKLYQKSGFLTFSTELWYHKWLN